MKKKAIIFDVDGTLWDSRAVMAEAWTTGCRERGVKELTITADMLTRMFGKTMVEIENILFRRFDYGKRQELMESCYKQELPYIEAEQASLFYPGVDETLFILDETYELYIVSNCQCGYIETMLYKSDFAHLIKDYECFGNTFKSKGENIRLLMERNNIKAAVYVGDTQGDELAAAEAGIPYIHAAYGFGKAKHPSQTLMNIRELPDCLQAM